MPEKLNQEKKGHKKIPLKSRAIRAILLPIFIVLLLAGAGTLTIVYSYVKEAPEFQPWLLQPPLASHLYERTGKEITTLYGEQNRVQISLEEIPIHVQNAFIAIEDERFYKHHGVDIFAIARAFFSNLLDRNLKEQGGSTITQQLVKNAMLTREKNTQPQDTGSVAGVHSGKILLKK
jgi:penicillin-binding protein 1A